MAEETNGFSSSKYLSRSWALLTRDKGWIKPVLVLAVSKLVPIAGPLGVSGYTQEWARLTAWGVDSAPKQKNVKVGECIGAGWRTFLASLGWSAIYVVVAMLLSNAATSTSDNGMVFLSFLLDVLLWVLNLSFVAFIAIARLRATIYQKAKAGYKISRIWEMIKHDPSGLMHIIGIAIIEQLLVGAVLIVFALIAFSSVLPTLLRIIYMMESSYGYGYDYGMSTYFVEQLSTLLAGIAPIVVIGWYCYTVVVVIFNLLINTATALWFRQFNVPQWGASDDPLPTPLTSDAVETVPPAIPAPSPTSSDTPAPDPTVSESAPDDSVMTTSSDDEFMSVTPLFPGTAPDAAPAPEAETTKADEAEQGPTTDQPADDLPGKETTPAEHAAIPMPPASPEVTSQVSVDPTEVLSTPAVTEEIPIQATEPMNPSAPEDQQTKGSDDGAVEVEEGTAEAKAEASPEVGTGADSSSAESDGEISDGEDSTDKPISLDPIPAPEPITLDDLLDGEKGNSDTDDSNK